MLRFEINIKKGVDILDYKFFCFDGIPRYCQVISERNSVMAIDFFDHDWKHQPFHEPCNYPFALQQPLPPVCLDKMWVMAQQLAEGKPFVRIDFYNIGEKIYFGEITFYPTSGFGRFDPDNYDELIGGLIKLPI